MAANEKPVPDDLYELLPHQDILELKEELRSLKTKPTEKNLQISMVELSTKLDRLIDIFDEAQETLKVEEGAGMSFQEKMRPLIERMDKVLEQNSEIARGLIGINDIVTELADKVEKGVSTKKEAPSDPFAMTPEPLDFDTGGPPGAPPLGQPMQTPRSLPPLTPESRGSGPIPPPPKRV